MLATYAVRGVLAIADDNDSPGSRPIVQGLGALAGLRDGRLGAASDDDNPVAVRALRHDPVKTVYSGANSSGTRLLDGRSSLPTRFIVDESDNQSIPCSISR